MGSMILCFFCYVLLGSTVMADEKRNDTRPYEFSFNIVDFQHRYEKQGRYKVRKLSRQDDN